MGLEAFSYEGKRALVVGGATGMGAAAAKIVKELGGEVLVMDHAEITHPVDKAIKVDLRDRASVDAAIAEVDGPIHAVFSCAGVADGSEGLMLVNFISQRHILETLIGKGTLPRDSAVVMISSVAGLGWEHHVPTVIDFLDTPDWDSASSWMDAHADLAHYAFSKRVIDVYVRRRCHDLLKQGIRINAIEPGPTDTPLARANADMWLGFAEDYRSEAGAKPSTPEEQGYPMAFLNSRAASHVSGITMLIDLGYVSSALVGAYDSPLVKYLMAAPAE
jgi:NAD(P)-dependent dehydrogenase (short-subunit alcohol dehydrogenase family)